MNGIKLLGIGMRITRGNRVLCIVNGSIDWPSGMAVLFGTLVGGYYSAKVSRRIPQQYVRTTVIIASFLNHRLLLLCQLSFMRNTFYAN